MTKNTIGAPPHPGSSSARVRLDAGQPGQGDPATCDLYSPGHQIHYTHQAEAVHSASRVTRDALLEGTLLTLTFEDGHNLRWRHHDPDRLGRIIDLLRNRCVVYPDFHALRVGPYWFNCCDEADEWQDCDGSAPSGDA